ncbi:MAG TPA: cytochrome c [Terriglobales bacterium]|jgi:hypothetical protein
MNWKRTLPLACLTLAALSGCRQDMHNQPKYIPYRSSEFFANGSSARQPVLGTVARGHLNADTYFFTGKINGVDGNVMPFRVTKAVLQRGEERFNIYCSPCHSRVGDGNGMIVQRGYRRAANLHDVRLLNAPLGHFYDVIAHGWGAMPDYSAQMDPNDRWSVVAYVRALQLSQNATLNDVPADQRNNVRTRQQVEAELQGGELGQQESGASTTEGSTRGGAVDNKNVGMSPTTGGTSSNNVNRNANEQSGGQVIQSSRPNPQGQSGHPQGGDTGEGKAPTGSKGRERGQSALPTGHLQSGPNQHTPQDGQARPEGDNRNPK